MTAHTEDAARPANPFAQSAAIAWVIVALMVASMAWTDAHHLFIRDSHPIVVGWPLLLATLALAILLSAPRLIPKQRAMACKLWSIGLLLIGFLFVAGGAAFCFGMLAGKIFFEARKT